MMMEVILDGPVTWTDIASARSPSVDLPIA